MNNNTARQLSVLLVEDDEMVRETLADVLESRGFKVMTARNGAECLNLARQHRYDAIVTDIIMPEKEGIETIAALRQAKVDTKIIAMSGGGRTRNEEFLDMARRMGADFTFRKPFDPENLVRQIQSTSQAAAKV